MAAILTLPEGPEAAPLALSAVRGSPRPAGEAVAVTMEQPDLRESVPPEEPEERRPLTRERVAAVAVRARPEEPVETADRAISSYGR